jgi:dihydrofolate reductase
LAVRFAVFIAVSLDGFIARADGGLDWLDPFHGEDHGYGPFFAGVDALVIGRGTYDTVLGFPEWPYGGKRLIVCTAHPASPRHGEELWSGPPRALAERLDREGVRRVYLDGGALIRSFLREGLVDEISINVVPVILGGGIPLFASGLPEIPLRFVESKSYPSGLVQIRYQRA